MISKKANLDWLNGLGDELHLRVTPKASANRIKVENQPNGSVRIHAYVTTVPEDNKANKAVIELLAETLSIPKSSFTIIRGLKSRDKIVRIQKN